MTCLKCGKIAMVLIKKDQKILQYCTKCKLIFAKNYEWRMGVLRESERDTLYVQVGSPAWNELIKGVDLPEGKQVDDRYEVNVKYGPL